MKPSLIFFIFLIFISNFSSSSSIPPPKTSIVFTTLGRSSYNFDIYSLPITLFSKPSSKTELKLTDGVSVNYNGYFPNSTSSSLFSLLQNPNPNPLSSPPTQLVYVTERNGTFDIYLDSIYDSESLTRPGSRSSLELRIAFPLRVQRSLLGLKKGTISMKDRPSLVGDDLIYVSTHQDPGLARASWAAVYLTHIPTGSTRRLTPEGVIDFSPAVSPSGVWTAVASYGFGRGWSGEIEELGTDIYVFLTRTGSSRVKVVEHGGWPCWVDDETFFFHRRNADDGWWSVYKASLPRGKRIGTESVVIERVTPPGLHSFTPATSPGNKNFIALATRRPGSEYRHIELFDLKKGVFIELTRLISPNANHLNPFISPDSTRVGYHRCRGEGDRENPIDHLFLENLEIPDADISFFRLDGSFPSFSPSGDRIAYVRLPGVYVVNSDGSNRRVVFDGMAFPTVWDPVRKGVVYSSVGPAFAPTTAEVDVISINVDEEPPSYKKLTQGGLNNAFPSPSPDGKWIVFRSGRSGYKNLYIMDALEGETAAIHRLTEGPWADTMPNWSPDGDWIAFASDREDPGSGSFELFMIHPNGTRLHKVIQSGTGGRANHPCFSPDGKSIVFTSDYAGVSAEPISNPHSYQPYGEIFIANVDGSGIRRMTHNSYEDGTPAWGPRFLSPENIARPPDESWCGFEDCHWLNIESKASVKAQC